MKLVFAGTPRVAVPSLEALMGSGHDVVAVVTRPDATAGRGRRLTPSPVAIRAAELGLEVLKPAHPRDLDFQYRLRTETRGVCGSCLRRPATHPGPRDPASRLDQPAFLSAAQMAWSGPGAAGRDGG